MSASTGPILAMGAITMANQSLFNGKPIDWRVPVATAEQLLGGSAVRGLALIALGTVLLTRVDRSVPAPAESALKWWRERG